MEQAKYTYSFFLKTAIQVISHRHSTPKTFLPYSIIWYRSAFLPYSIIQYRLAYSDGHKQIDRPFFSTTAIQVISPYSSKPFLHTNAGYNKMHIHPLIITFSEFFEMGLQVIMSFFQKKILEEKMVQKSPY